MGEKTAARAPEKSSNFSIACGLLSQYIKQKRSLGDLMASRSYEAKGATQPPTTMSLFPGLNVSAGEDYCDSETKKRAEDSEQNITKPTDLFRQLVNMDLTAPVPVLQDTTKEANEREKERAQLTIFYDGKVLVFDNFPADKAKELIDMANKKCSSMQDFSFAAPSSSMAAVAVAAAADPPPKSPLHCSDAVASTSGEQKDGKQDDPPKPAQTAGSNMPVARRASLHRFLEKRKDRINAKAPYQLNGSPPPAKPEGSPSWLGLGPKSSKPGSSRND